MFAQLLSIVLYSALFTDQQLSTAQVRGRGWRQVQGNDDEVPSGRVGLGSVSLTSAVLDAALPGSPDAAIAEKLRQLAVVLDELAQVDVSTLSDAAVAEAAVHAERLARRTSSAVTDRLVVEASDRDVPRKLGYRDVRGYLSHHLHIGDPAARHRLITATGTFTSYGGERLAPTCPRLAEHVVEGTIAGAHAQAVLDILKAVPHEIPDETKVAAEAQMADYATQFTPAEITNLGMRLLAHLDPDGSITDDKDRKRRRRLWVNRQNAQLMSRLTADLDPVARARLDVVLEAWATPGMNNPDDPASPSGPATAANAEDVAAAAERDTRSRGQRNHDALSALLERVLASGMLGNTHRGLPIQVIVKTTLAELEAGAGVAQTATGSLLPIADVVEMAASSGAQPLLAVFADHTTVPLYLGRSKRIATVGQRFASFASDGGSMCSGPGCTEPASRVQMHHAAKDWADGGLTDIDQLVPACAIHNRRVGPKPGQYTTRIITEGPDTGRVAWRLNSAPGMPLNPEHINRAADVAADLRDYLGHRSPSATGHVSGTDVGYSAHSVSPSRMADGEGTDSAGDSRRNTGAARSSVEASLTSAVPSGLVLVSDTRVDFSWPPSGPDAPDPPKPPSLPDPPGPASGVDPPGGTDPPSLPDAA